MSEIFSFRLGDDDPDEAEALAILAELFESGYELREIITHALIAAADKLPLRPRPIDELRGVAAELRAALSQANALASRLQAVGQVGPANVARPDPEGLPVSDSLVAGLRRATRPGMRLDG